MQTEDERQRYNDLRGSILSPNGGKRDSIKSISDLVSRILETCCNPFDRLQDVETLQFIHMFAHAIGTTVSHSHA